MLITTKTTICFRIPEEYRAAERFKTDNPDWVESVTTQFIGFAKQGTYAVESEKKMEGKISVDDAATQ